MSVILARRGLTALPQLSIPCINVVNRSDMSDGLLSPTTPKQKRLKPAPLKIIDSSPDGEPECKAPRMMSQEAFLFN